MVFKPSIQKVWRKKIAAQSKVVEGEQASMAIALTAYTQACSANNRIHQATHKLCATIVIPPDPGIAPKFHNKVGDDAMHAICNGLSGDEYDLLPQPVIKASAQIMELQIELFETGQEVEETEGTLRHAKAAFEKAENDLRQLTSSLNDYVNSKEAMKALGKAQYNAWKKTQKAFLDGF